MNRTGGVIRGLSIQTLSVERFRSARIPTDFMPSRSLWPVLGMLPRIPEVVVLGSSNLYDQNFNTNGVTITTPDLRVDLAFVEAKAIIEAARPGRTFVFLRGYHRGVIPGWRNYPNDLSFDLHEDIPGASSDAVFLPSLLVLHYGDPNLLRREFNDGTNSVLLPYVRQAIARFPKVAVRLWDDGRDVTSHGIHHPTLSDTAPARESQFRALGLDYEFLGLAEAPLDGSAIAARIASHFGFSL